MASTDAQGALQGDRTWPGRMKEGAMAGAVFLVIPGQQGDRLGSGSQGHAGALSIAVLVGILPCLPWALNLLSLGGADPAPSRHSL